jgi:hypothetical protein
MTWCIISLFLAFALFFLGGFLRGLFECVLLFDSVDDWLGPYWAFDLFKADKDRNKDGKVSFFEINFPNDGGHRAKLYELNCYAVGACFLALANSFSPLPGWYILALFAPIWWVNSIGFLVSFNKYRYAKK